MFPKIQIKCNRPKLTDEAIHTVSDIWPYTNNGVWNVWFRLPIAESRIPVKKWNFEDWVFVAVFRRKSPGVWPAGMILYMWPPGHQILQQIKQTNNSWWFRQGLIQHVWSGSGSISKKRCKHFHFCAVKVWKLRHCLVITLTHYIIVLHTDPTQSVVRTFARNTSDMPRRTWRWRISFPPPLISRDMFRPPVAGDHGKLSSRG